MICPCPTKSCTGRCAYPSQLVPKTPPRSMFYPTDKPAELARLEERVAVRNDTLEFAIETYNGYVDAVDRARFPSPRSVVIEEMMETLRNAISEIKVHLADAEQILAAYKLSQK